MKKITAVDINSRIFRKRFRGFDITEVENFLEIVAEELKSLTNENSSLREKASRLSTELETLHREHQAAVLQAKEAAERCEDMLAAARAAVDEMLATARSEAEQIRDRVDAMKREKESLEAYFTSFLTFNIELLRTWKRESHE